MTKLLTFIISILFLSPLNAQQHHGWVVGNSGKIINTSNEGTTWSNQNTGVSNNLYSIYFVNTTTGWATGEIGRILKTTNGGSDWISQSSGT